MSFDPTGKNLIAGHRVADDGTFLFSPAIGSGEGGLPAARLQGERGRTVRQLRPFAKHIRDGADFDRRHDAVLPDRVALPWPDLKMVQRPIGPVAVFGASNFLPAFLVAGKDLAAVLTEGWPVQWCVAVLPPRAPISEPPAGT